MDTIEIDKILITSKDGIIYIFKASKIYGEWKDTSTDGQNDRHCDSMTDPAQMAESVKILLA